MSLQKTGIPYLERVWNVTRGCSHCGPACENCYAERYAKRFCGRLKDYEGTFQPPPPFQGFADVNGWTGRVELLEDKLDEPLRTRKPARIGVCFTSDLFHESLPDEAIDRVFAVMALCPQQTFVLLTKRWKRMHEWFTSERPLREVREDIAYFAEHIGKIVWDQRGSERHNYFGCARIGDISNRRVFPGWPLPNVWLGVTAWDQPSFDEAAGYLLRTPAALRWWSYEPALGPVDCTRIPISGRGVESEPLIQVNALRRASVFAPHIDWIVAGCESGPGRRPAQNDWFRSLRDQCVEAGVPFYLKQSNADTFCLYNPAYVIEKPFLDGRQWLQIPEVRR
jgi:protein gp37